MIALDGLGRFFEFHFFSRFLRRRYRTFLAVLPALFLLLPSGAFAGGGHAPPLVLEKTGPATARPGDLITYRIVVKNTSKKTYGGVQVLDAGAQNLVYEGSPNSECVPSASGAVCTIKELCEYQTVEFQLNFRVVPNCGCPTKINNGAVVTVMQPNVKSTESWFSTSIDCHSQPEPECKDGKDNDGDGKIDMADPGCWDPSDDTENTPQCSDNRDNDHDGLIDVADPGCDGPTDDSEDNPECADNKDNDGDGKIDYPADPGCTNTGDPDESDSVSPLDPLVNCVANNGNGTYTAYFSYQNNSGSVINLPPGVCDGKNQNIFSPSPAVRSQPGVFQPGLKNPAFAEVFDGSALTWTVQVAGAPAKSVTAQVGHSRPCASVEPILECVDQVAASGPKAYVAYFSYQNNNEFEVAVPIGEQNRFEPAPDDRGQPNSFFTGYVKNVLTVEFDGVGLTWKLRDRAVTANKDCKPCHNNQSPVCSAAGPYQQSCQGTQTSIALDGAGSSDPEGKSLSYHWTTSCTDANFSDATVASPSLTLLGPGQGAAASCAVTLTVSDGVLSSSCDAAVTVPACDPDCNGVPGGSAVLDQCGVCGGNGTTCVDCNGVPNGGAVVDKCGVCGGSNACVDCNGVPNGGAVVDECNVCGGNGSTCVQCTEADVTEQLFELDGDAKNQEANVIQAANRLGRIDTSKEAQTFIKKVKAQADQLSNQNWTLTWSLPQIVLNCANSSTCAQVDNGGTLAQYGANAVSLRDLSNLVTARIKKARGELSTNDKKLQAAAQKLYEKSIADASGIPRFTSVCQ